LPKPSGSGTIGAFWDLSLLHRGWDKIVRKGTGVLLLTVLTLALLEAGSWIYLSVLDDLTYSDLAREKSKHVNIVMAGKNPGDLRFWNNQRFQLHPYFGYTLEPWSDEGVNNAGLISDKIYPYESDRDSLAVGVFGGSVAGNIFFHIDRVRRKQVEKLLLPQIRDKGYTRVEFLNFTLGGYKQPIDLFNFIYYLNTIDVAIFIGGFNEVHQFGTNVANHEFPADFPKWKYWRVLGEGNFSPSELRLIAQLVSNRDRQDAVTAFASTPVLDHSMFVHMIWRAATAVLMKSVGEIRGKLEEEAGRERVYPQITGSDDLESISNAFIEKLRSYMRSANAVGRAAEVPTLFVLQPNQYVPNSKPLSDVEKREFLTSENLPRITAEWYPRVRKLYSDLGSEGIFTADLTEVFSDTQETTYADECCHLNALGRRMVTDRIFEAIVSREGFLDTLPRADERQRSELR